MTNICISGIVNCHILIVFILLIDNKNNKYSYFLEVHLSVDLSYHILGSFEMKSLDYGYCIHLAIDKSVCYPNMWSLYLFMYCSDLEQLWSWQANWTSRKKCIKTTSRPSMKIALVLPAKDTLEHICIVSWLMKQ